MSVLHGAGGGGKSQKQYVPTESPNTLQSVSKGRILDLIAHGPIVGLVNGLQSISLNDTPLQNSDGSFNFEGVTVTTREGYPNQDVIPGFRSVENPVSVATKVTHALPIVRSVGNNDADAVVVIIQLNALVRQTDQGDRKGTSVEIAIDTRTGSSGWTTRVTDEITGKTTSPYQRGYRVELPVNTAWEVRVRRVTGDFDADNIQGDTTWLSMTEVVDARLNYPDSALVGLELDSRLFGNQMPSRSYDMKLSIIKVPSNYNPVTRAYTGLWNGSFKLAWTDNPAWCYYDLATHPVIGAGLENVDKWWLYQIGQYCDELVPDGYGAMEPRFTLNTLFAAAEEAITTLATLASAFRGMTYWGTNTVVPVADMPTDPKKLVTPANVIDGEFEYSGTSLKERHSVAVVMWNDPADNDKPKPEMVEDPDSIDLFGWREVQVTAFGCTSRGQAHRLGSWILYSERMETETVSYAAASDHADLNPGDIIELSDPDRAGARLSGRVAITGTGALTLDKRPPEAGGATWYLSAILPSGVIERRKVSAFNEDRVTLSAAFSVAPIVGAVWILSSTSVMPPQYRVVSREETAEGTYNITATEYDPNKYSIVELGLKLPQAPQSLIPIGPLAPPMSITAEVYKYLAGGTEHQALLVSWTPSKDPRTLNYVAEVQGPDDVKWRTVHNGPGASFDEKDAEPGQWMIRVRAVQFGGTGSAWVVLTTNIAGLLLPVRPDTVDVFVNTFDITLRPRGAYPGAMYEFWRSSAALTDGLIESNAVRLSVSTDLVDVGLKSATLYFYYIRGANAYGVSAWYPVQATTLGDFEDILAALDEDIRRPGGLFEEMIGEAATDTTSAITIARGEIDGELALVRGDIADARLDVTNLEVGVSSLSLTNELGTIRHLAALALHEGSSARSSTEEVVRSTEDESLATRITTVVAATEANSAALTVEQLARTTADSALSAQITTLETTVNDDISASITAEQIARANADGALAADITTLTSSTDNQFASVTQQFTAQTSYTDGAVARAITTVTVNGKKAVFGISVDGTVSEIGAVADRFYVYNPVGGTYTLAFAVVNGQTVMQDAMIRNASITTAKIVSLTFNKLTSEDGTLAFENGKLKAAYIQADTLDVRSAANFTGPVTFSQVQGLGTLAAKSSVTTGEVTGLGSLATQSSVGYSSLTGTKPPTNADNTAAGTAFDTSRVSGQWASTVKDWAYSGAVAANTTNSWVRPGTTRINGNQIYTGDAYVDTLQIKGRAVTLPVHAYAAGQVTVTGWANVCTLSYTASGDPAILMASAQLHGYTSTYYWDDAWGSYSETVVSTIIWRVLVDGVVFRSGAVSTSTVVSLQAAIQPSAGWSTMRLQASCSTRGGGKVEGRSLLVLEVKR